MVTNHNLTLNEDDLDNANETASFLYPCSNNFFLGNIPQELGI